MSMFGCPAAVEQFTASMIINSESPREALTGRYQHQQTLQEVAANRLHICSAVSPF